MVPPAGSMANCAAGMGAGAEVETLGVVGVATEVDEPAALEAGDWLVAALVDDTDDVPAPVAAVTAEGLLEDVQAAMPATHASRAMGKPARANTRGLVPCNRSSKTAASAQATVTVEPREKPL